ncbi:MAG: DEAD/DEAH box helicase, partial [Bacteroidota bacterium]
LQGQSTIPPDRGLFLDQTRRLHPEICRFTSEQYYDGRLQSLPGLEKQVICDSVGNKRYGLEFVVSAHTGNEDRSLEEVEIVRKLVEEFLGGDYSWVQRNEQEQPLSINDILVVAPFNLQVDAIRQALPEGARVGTVDKFQGQEAPIVIYSLTSSSVEDAPRGISFLLSRSRMNVATSRAKCLAIVVGTESLVSATVQDAPGVQLANGLCRFRELAEGSRI